MGKRHIGWEMIDVVTCGEELYCSICTETDYSYNETTSSVLFLGKVFCTALGESVVEHIENKTKPKQCPFNRKPSCAPNGFNSVWTEKGKGSD